MNYKKILIFIIFFNYYCLSNEINQVDLTNTLRKEYLDIKTKYKNPRYRKQKDFINERIPWMLGHIMITEENYPLLYETIKDISQTLNIPFPIITIFRGNMYYDLMANLGKGDQKINAFATSISKYIGWICIGEDLINYLTYDEVRAIIAHELGHIKQNHIVKSLIIGTAINYMSSYTFNIFSGYLPYCKIPWINFDGIGFHNFSFENNVISTLDIPRTILRNVVDVPINSLSRKFEKEADLISLEVVKNYALLINALDKIDKINKKKHPFWYWYGNIMSHIFLFPTTHPSDRKRTAYLKKAAIEAGYLIKEHDNWQNIIDYVSYKSENLNLKFEKPILI